MMLDNQWVLGSLRAVLCCQLPCKDSHCTGTALLLLLPIYLKKTIITNQKIGVANKGDNSYSLEDVIFQGASNGYGAFPFSNLNKAAVTESHYHMLFCLSSL